MKKKAVQDVRTFNRWYTDVIGLLNRHLLDSAYSLAEARLIYEIHAAGSIRASQIMASMQIDKSYLSRLLKKLEKQKVVATQPAPEDGRAILLRLTQKGVKEFAALDNASDQQIGGLLRPLSEAAREQLVGHMKAIMHLLTTTI